MADIKLKNRLGEEVTFTGITTVSIPNVNGEGYVDFAEGGERADNNVRFKYVNSNLILENTNTEPKIQFSPAASYSAQFAPYINDARLPQINFGQLDSWKIITKFNKFGIPDSINMIFASSDNVFYAPQLDYDSYKNVYLGYSIGGQKVDREVLLLNVMNTDGDYYIASDFSIEDYKLALSLYDSDGNLLSQSTIDVPDRQYSVSTNVVFGGRHDAHRAKNLSIYPFECAILTNGQLAWGTLTGKTYNMGYHK